MKIATHSVPRPVFLFLMVFLKGGRPNPTLQWVQSSVLKRHPDPGPQRPPDLCTCLKEQLSTEPVPPEARQAGIPGKVYVVLGVYRRLRLALKDPQLLPSCHLENREIRWSNRPGSSSTNVSQAPLSCVTAGWADT